MKKLLLDTYVFLWLIADSKRLSARWREEREDPLNELYLSVVSVWEIALKYRIGKLALPESPAQYIPVRRERHRIAALP